MALNQKQQLAVNTIEGPVMVIAGPGTGKTQIIAHRIANIFKKTDTAPSSILALTFTDSGAKAMHSRLLDLLGPTSYQVHISTFHSFCQEIISTFPDYFIIGENAQGLTDLERLEIIQEILTKKDFEILKPINAPLYYSSALTSSIQQLKRENVTPEKFNIILKDALHDLESNQENLTKAKFELQNKALQKNIELLKFYEFYQENLQKRSRYDFEDMINKVIEILSKNEELLLSLQEKYQYFLVDEYQDTNNAQNQLINLLCSFWGSSANLFVVLDDEQCVYRFNGASLENALEFKKTYPSAKTITLDQNYRSQSNILNASRSVIDNNKISLQNSLPEIKRKLVSNVKYIQKPVQIIKLPHYLIEADSVAEKISSLIKNGVKPSEIAIIGRNNADLIPFAESLGLQGIDVNNLSGDDVLKSPTVLYFLELLKLIKSLRLSLDDLNLFTILHFPFLKFDTLETLKFFREAGKNRQLVSDYILSLPQKNKYHAFLTQVAHWQDLSVQKNLLELFDLVLKDTSLLSWLVDQTDHFESIEDLNAFYEFSKNLTQNKPSLQLDQFLAYLDLMQENNLKISRPDFEISQNKVVLTTAHKAKGLEWESVFVVKCIDGLWGNQIPRQLIKLPENLTLSLQTITDPLEDERRLFYVALTRAKKTLTLTYATTYQSSGKARVTLPSQFLSEIDSELIKFDNPSFSDSKIQNLILKRLSPPAAPTSDQEKVYLQSIVADFTLSPTALNTFLNCPYQFKLNNLYRLPKAKEPYLAFGTAIHAALQTFYQKGLTLTGAKRARDEISGRSDLNYLLIQFEKKLQQEILSSDEFKTRLKEGQKILTAYFNFFEKEFKPALQTEKSFGGSFHPVMLDDISLSGKVDRIDKVGDNVRITDYKTGKRQTRGEIEGTTQNSTGDYKRQLVFYQLLTELDKNFSHQVSEVELDFVSAPSQEGRSGKEKFIIAQSEVDDLKELIKDTMKKIRALEFPHTTYTSVCARCDFAPHCWPNGQPAGR